MNSEAEQNPLAASIEEELVTAQRALAAAKQRAADLEKAKIEKTLTEIAERKAAQERAAAEAIARHLKIEEEFRTRRQKAEDERKAAERRQQEEEERLRARADELRRADEDRAKRQAEAKRLADEAHLIEQENNRVAAELAKQSPTIQVSPVDSNSFFPGNESLAMDPVITGEHAADYDTMGLIKLRGRTTQGQTQAEIPAKIEPVKEYIFPSEFNVSKEHLDNRVFAKMFGPERSFALFISPQDGNLVANGYRWRVDGIISRRFTPNTQCVIELLPNGEYALMPLAFVAGSRERVPVVPVQPDDLFKPEPLLASELRSDSKVDDEEILSDSAHGICHSRNEAVINGK